MPCGFLRFRLFLGHRDGSVCVCQQKRCRERPHQKAKPPDPIAALRYAGKTCGRMGQGRARPHGVRMRGKMQGACLPWAWAGGDRRASFHKGIQKSGSVSGCRSAVVWLWSGPVAQVMSCFWYRTVAIRQETKNQIREKTFTTPNAARVCSLTGRNRFVRSTSATMMPVDAI